MASLSFVQSLRRLAQQAPDQAVITCQDEVLSRRDLELLSNGLALAFADCGVTSGSLVTLALPNGAPFYVAALAAWKLGATPQPVSARLPEPELRSILDLAKPTLVVGGSAELAGGRPHMSEAAVRGIAGTASSMPDVVSTSWKASTSGGSTGRPKVIVSRTPAAFDPDAPFMEMRPNQRQLVPAPLYHSGPLSVSVFGMVRGHQLVVMPRFDPTAALTLINQHRIQWLLLVPTMMSRIWRLDSGLRASMDTSSIETLWHGAAPCPAWLKRAWIGWLGPERVFEIYGGTEGQGSTVIRGDEWLRHPGSVGRPPPVFEFRVLDEAGRAAAPGEIGEIFMRPKAGPGSTYYYLGAEARSTEDGFESLGDMGWLDAEGYLYIADRRTDMILSGGANIYPAEVEAALDAHPSVRSSAVIGLPDEDLGNRVHAIVEAKAGTEAQALLEFVRSRLAPYKAPRSIEFVEEPLRDDAGKVRRSALRAARLGAASHP